MNKKIILKQRPFGEPKLEDFELLEEEIRNPEDNEVLLKTIYMSLDPYMRGRMNDAKSYAKAIDVENPTENVSPLITTSSSPQKVKFAKFLSENNIVMYSAYWCPHCHDQKQLFGKEAVKELKIVECAKDGKDNEYELCQKKEISGFPSWEINGEIISGTRDLNELAIKTGYKGDSNF